MIFFVFILFRDIYILSIYSEEKSNMYKIKKKKFKTILIFLVSVAIILTWKQENKTSVFKCNFY